MKSVSFDIDTQIDFLYPAGALYVPGAERIVAGIERLNGFAAQNGIPVVSTTCAHSEEDPEFNQWPPHCVVGTTGQLKPAGLLLEKRTILPNTVAEPAVEGAQQIILEKQQLNLFTNPNLERLLQKLGAEEYVVYGVVTEYCVKFAAMGLLERGKPVRLVTDAIQTLRAEDSDCTLREFTARGGILTTISEVCTR